MRLFCSLNVHLVYEINANIFSSDVVGRSSDVDVYIYDRANHEAFLGHVNVTPDVFRTNSQVEGWYKLEARDPKEDQVSGEIHLKFQFHKTSRKKYGLEDFEFLKLVGKGAVPGLFRRRFADISKVLSVRCIKSERRTPGKFSLLKCSLKR